MVPMTYLQFFAAEVGSYIILFIDHVYILSFNE